MDKSRKLRILEKLDADGFVSVASLSAMLGCTEATTRRELTRLEESGLARRVHGGAVRTGTHFARKNVKESYSTHLHEKLEIARLAYELIREGETLIIDDASSCLHLGTMIRSGQKRNLTVITNSILLAEHLMDAEGLKLVLIGGSVAGNLSATEGGTACRQLDSLHADKAFIGVNGVDFERGITLTGYPQQEVKRRMMAVSRETYILADSSKFGKVFPSVLCEAQDAVILTDRGLPRQMEEEGDARGVRIRRRGKAERAGEAPSAG